MVILITMSDLFGYFYWADQTTVAYGLKTVSDNQGTWTKGKVDYKMFVYYGSSGNQYERFEKDLRNPISGIASLMQRFDLSGSTLYTSRYINKDLLLWTILESELDLDIYDIFRLWWIKMPVEFARDELKNCPLFGKYIRFLTDEERKYMIADKRYEDHLLKETNSKKDLP